MESIMVHSALLIESFVAPKLAGDPVSFKVQCTLRDANKTIKRMGSLAFITVDGIKLIKKNIYTQSKKIVE